MRELSEDEQEFVQRAISEREDAAGALPPKEYQKAKKAQRKKAGYVPQWKRLSNWAAFILLLPIGFLSVFMYGLWKTRQMMGSGALEWLSEQDLPPEFEQTAAESGVPWLPDFLVVYANREYIIGGVFTVAIVIVIGLLLYDVLVVKKREDAELEENEEVDDNVEESEIENDEVQED